MKRYLIIFIIFTALIATPLAFLDAREDSGGWNRTFFDDRRDCFPPPGDCLDDIIVTP
ncbi:MAG: hypothetical protein GXO78_01835 [Calditrichaeota bacterium]|nr:hypothetical protein [Calditrichota bacterium]